MLYYDSKAITDTGNYRQINQDSFADIVDHVNNKYIGLFCVADGMGGLSDGEYASKLAIVKTVEWYKHNLHLLGRRTFSRRNIKKKLKRLFYAINTDIFLYGKTKNVKVGTTYSLLLLVGKRYYVVHAGDSRIYLKRKEKLFMLTKDQTWVNEQLEKGTLSPEQAQNHPRKNVLANCMGCFEEPSICMGDGKILGGDSFLLCSDGLYNLTTTEEILKGMDCKNIDYMSEEFLRMVKARGAYDNVTLLMIKVFKSAPHRM